MDQRHDDFQPPRLSATMASQRLLVLDYVRDYLTRWGASPSYGEIGAHLGIDRTIVRRALRSLERDGLVLRTPGPRGLALPGAEADAIRKLRAMGWTIDAAAARVTKETLLPPAALDYIEPSAEGGTDGGAADTGTKSA